jgi:hypothetical protein
MRGFAAKADLDGAVRERGKGEVAFGVPLDRHRAGGLAFGPGLRAPVAAGWSWGCFSVIVMSTQNSAVRRGPNPWTISGRRWSSFHRRTGTGRQHRDPAPEHTEQEEKTMKKYTKPAATKVSQVSVLKSMT